MGTVAISSMLKPKLLCMNVIAACSCVLLDDACAAKDG